MPTVALVRALVFAVNGSVASQRTIVGIISGLTLLFVVAAGAGAWTMAGSEDWSVVNVRWIPVLLVVGTCSFFLRFLRWHVLVVKLAPDLRPWPSLRIYVSGFALGLTPARLGELLKFSFLRKEVGLPEVKAAPVFPLERATEAFSCLLLAVVAAAAGQLPQITPSRGTLVVIAVIPAAAVTGLLLRAILHSAEVSSPLRRHVWLHELLSGTATVARPVPVILATACAVAARGFEALAFYAALMMTGADVMPAVAGLASGISGIAGGLSLMPGGLSAVEASLVATTMAYGGQLNSAIVAALLSRAATLWVWVPAGLWFAARNAWTRR